MAQKNHCNEASGRLGSAGSHCYGAQARDDKLKLCDQIVKLMIDIDGYIDGYRPPELH